MSNYNRPSRSSSIPIPASGSNSGGASGRRVGSNIEDILNNHFSPTSPMHTGSPSSIPFSRMRTVDDGVRSPTGVADVESSGPGVSTSPRIPSTMDNYRSVSQLSLNLHRRASAYGLTEAGSTPPTQAIPMNSPRRGSHSHLASSISTGPPAWPSPSTGAMSNSAGSSASTLFLPPMSRSAQRSTLALGRGRATTAISHSSPSSTTQIGSPGGTPSSLVRTGRVFEPRVVRSASSTLDGHSHPDDASTHSGNSARQPSLSPSRNRRSSGTLLRRTSGHSLRPSGSGVHNIPSGSFPASSSMASFPDLKPFITSSRPGERAAQNSPNNDNSSGATTFETPSYLQLSSLRDKLVTEVPPTLPPSRYNRSSERVYPPFASYLDGTGGHLNRRRDITPCSDSDEDSERSLVRGPHGRRDQVMRARGRERPSATSSITSSAGAEKPWAAQERTSLLLPTRWSGQDRSPSLNLSQDGRELLFPGPVSANEDRAAAARANHPIPPACGIYYYEIHIVHGGQKRNISIGFSVATVKLSRLPGWDKNSWGYHGDDGKSFASEKAGTPFGPQFNTGDTIGCGIDFTTNKAFYTRNGEFLGTVFENVGKDEPIYPSVGLRTPGEQIRVNFGQEPFMFRIDDHAHAIAEATWKSIQQTPIHWSIDAPRNLFTLGSSPNPDIPAASNSGEPSQSTSEVKRETAESGVKKEMTDDYVPMKAPEDFEEPINHLILSYLSHHGYESTARELKSASLARAKSRERMISLLTKSPPSRLTTDYSASSGLDIKMETDDTTNALHSSHGSSGDLQFHMEGIERPIENLVKTRSLDELASRQRIVQAVAVGDIESALRDIKVFHPAVLDLDGGLIEFKLRCRQFIELVLTTSDALKKVKQLRYAQHIGESNMDSRTAFVVDNPSTMDIDDDRSHLPRTNGFTNGHSVPSAAVTISPELAAASVDHDTLLMKTFELGKQLRAQYVSDMRREVQVLLNETINLLSYEDPLEAGNDSSLLASKESRSILAQEVNQAILQSQGKPSRPALERMYRQAATAIVELGMLGVGAAAYADIRKEFLDN